MKLKLAEQQVKGLINKLNEQQIDIEKDASNLSKLAQIVLGNKVDNSTQSTDDVKFADYIPTGNEMMHPLGHKEPISSGFGLRDTGIGSKDHKGVDIATPSGSPVYAPLDGVVESSRDTTPNPCGGFIKLNHNTIHTKFCHLRQMVVSQGDQVKKGQLIGYSGGGESDPMHGTATGPHLHYEILNVGGIAMNPVSVQHNLAENVDDKQKEKLANFVKFVKDELKISHAPTVAILNEKGDVKTTANYDYGKENKVIKVRAKNRMMVDVMRSIGHELAHHKQWEDGKLKVRPPDIGGPIEDEANALAGQLIKKFAKIDSTIYDE